MINAMDRFVLQAQLPDGRTVVEHFCANQPALSDTDRAILAGWTDVVEGIFQVTGRDRHAGLDTVNVIDELPYRIVSNRGPGVLAPARRRDYLLARVVPVGQSWMLSGACSILPARARPRLLRAAAELAMRDPTLALRNPAKLARAWQLQQRERSLLIEFFGADQVILPARTSNTGGRSSGPGGCANPHSPTATATGEAG